MPKYEAVIGLEVHAELQTRSKMFCSCPVVDSTQAAPNTTVCEICTGMPGTLPVINARAIEYAVKVGLALRCTIARTSVFARKNYFYPDLPKGYQISQYELPLAEHGVLPIITEAGVRNIRITRCHLEEDTGKLNHADGRSLVDFNRSGVPLLEIVSEPDLHTPEEVKAYATALRTLLRYLEVSSGEMEKGVIRFEANVSIRPKGATELGTRTEIKNLNSFRSLTHAVAFEIKRQSRLLDEGKSVLLQTLGWDQARSVTVPQRSKEEAHDYRYFPEPDLPPLVIEAAFVERVRKTLPELPEEKRLRFMDTYHLSAYTAGVLSSERDYAEYYEEALQTDSVDAIKLANWLSSDLFGLLNQYGQKFNNCKVLPSALAKLVNLISQGEINTPTGKAVLADMIQSGKDPQNLINEKGLGQINDKNEIEKLVAGILRDNPDQLAEYLSGKVSIKHWFFGQLMRATGGRANPQIAHRSLVLQLKSLEESHISE